MYTRYVGICTYAEPVCEWGNPCDYSKRNSECNCEKYLDCIIKGTKNRYWNDLQGKRNTILRFIIFPKPYLRKFWYSLKSVRIRSRS